MAHPERAHLSRKKMAGGFLGLRVVTEMDCGYVGVSFGGDGIVLNMVFGDGGLKLHVH